MTGNRDQGSGDRGQGTTRELRILLAIIAFGVLVRLYDIRQPLVDAWCGPEAETAMVAENFYLHGFNVLYPKVNWGSSASGRIPSAADWEENLVGYAGTEFPLVSFMAAAVYLLSGVAEWPGRFISVCFFALSVPFFALLLKRILKSLWAVFIATAVFTLMPLSIFMGREFMPDMAALSLSIIALYFFVDCVEDAGQARSFWLAGLATCLAILVRLPAITLALPFFYIAWTRFGPEMYSTKRLWGLLPIALLPPALWYAHAWQVSVKYLPNHFFWEDGIRIASWETYLRILSQTATSGVTLWLAAALVAGLLLPSPGKYGRLFHWWLLALVLLVVVAGEKNAHPWTQAAIVPIGAALAGSVCDFLGSKLSVRPGLRQVFLAGTAIFLCGVALSAYGYVRPWYRPGAEPLRQTGAAVNQLTSGNALVAVAGGGNPAVFYYSRRKCLRLENPAGDEDAIARLETLHNSGATHLVFTSETRAWLERYQGFRQHLQRKYRLVHQAENATLFALARSVAKASGAPVVPYQLIRSEMRKLPNWMHAVLEKPPTDQELIDLALELHAKYPETRFQICDDASGLRQLDRAIDNPTLLFPEGWVMRHYFGQVNVIEDGGHQKWRLADPKRDKILADLSEEPYRPWVKLEQGTGNRGQGTGSPKQ